MHLEGAILPLKIDVITGIPLCYSLTLSSTPAVDIYLDPWVCHNDIDDLHY